MGAETEESSGSLSSLKGEEGRAVEDRDVVLSKEASSDEARDERRRLEERESSEANHRRLGEGESPEANHRRSAV